MTDELPVTLLTGFLGSGKTTVLRRALSDKRDAGEIRAFRRLVVETSGLADPAPILFTLGTDPMLDQRLRLARVVTLVDAVTGTDTLQRFAEAARQAAVAD